ncbi:hypothetical protein SapgrDRAFT_1049 [Saprospira grandis DSM 2844]|uniref:Uncharacterized protein n=1 Tax=Saprospira grandis DSM 2844 TaxID=694433 RepID=J0NZ25_9BACT|nr:hypothetical protein SapgrDRAFT_1049 [Saprospira grandis DSM 2844]
MFWGLLPSAGATFRSSQVCSALRFGATHLRLLPLVVELRPKGLVLVCGFAAPFRIARPLNCCAALGFPLRH